MEHSENIHVIEGRITTEGKIKNNELIPQLIESGISQVEKYFIETEYINKLNSEIKIYEREPRRCKSISINNLICKLIHGKSVANG